MLKAFTRNLRRHSASTATMQRQCHRDVTRPVESEVQEIRIPVPWGHIAGKWWGSQNVRPILCLHGYQDNAGTWDTLAPLLLPDVSLLAVDFPGHGLSSHVPPGSAYHILNSAMTVQRIVQHYGWTKISLMGHSLGGVVAFLYSAIYPEMVEKYIALDTLKPLNTDPVKALEREGQNLDQIRHLGSMDLTSTPSYTYEEAVGRLHRNISHFATKQACEILIQRGTVRNADGKYSFTRDVRLKSAFGSRFTRDYVLQLAANVKCQILHIKALPGLLSRDTPEDVEEFFGVLKKSAALYKYHTVEGQHHVHLDFPERVVTMISEFLKCQ